MDTLTPTYPATSSVTSIPVGQGTLRGVTGNENVGQPYGWHEPPATLTIEQLQDANWLPLSAVAQSPGAVAFIADLMPRVVAYEAASGDRRTGRREAGLAKLRAAVGAIIGGLLRRWGRDQPSAVFRSRKKEDFTGSPVGVRQFTVAMDGLLSLGLLSQSKSIRYLFVDWGDGQAVFRESAPLLAVCGPAGIGWPLRRHPGHHRDRLRRCHTDDSAFGALRCERGHVGHEGVGEA